jgi:D-alanine-D-alanine ligase
VDEVDPLPGDLQIPAGTEVVFLALHGTYGEDGTVQSELEELGLPYTGCGVSASLYAFDKILTKRRCLKAGVPTARFERFIDASAPWPTDWQPPVVLKPTRQGSSVGLQFVDRIEDFPCAPGKVPNFTATPHQAHALAGAGHDDSPGRDGGRCGGHPCHEGAHAAPPGA